MPEAVAYLLEPPYLPFAVALGMMLGLTVLEGIGAGVSTLISALGLDYDLSGPEGDADIAGPLSWLGVGRVPVGVLIVTFLFLFGVTGVAVQHAVSGVTGSPLGAGLASAVALVPALLLNGVAAALLARVIPQDETSAVSTDSFVGKRARMLDCPARPELPARAELTDVHGQQHYVSVLPHETFGELRPGEEILLVRKDGPQFWGVAAGGSFI